MTIQNQINLESKRTRSYIALSFIISLCVIIYSACSDMRAGSNEFSENFSVTTPRVWIGSDYWSNPMQDWQVGNEHLTCLTSKKNRNVHILTYKVDQEFGTLSMSVDIKMHNLSRDTTHNWVGFSIGSKGKFNDYRDDAVFGQGLDLGITTLGNLFIGAPPISASIDEEVLSYLTTDMTLQVELLHSENETEIKLYAKDPNSGNIISEKKMISSDSIVSDGDIVLVSNYVATSTPDDKSVSFSNWKISGSKLKHYPDHSFGPILFSQYTLSKNTMTLTAQMAPVSTIDEKVYLHIKNEKGWKKVQEALIDPDARTATFVIDDWMSTHDVPYRLTYMMDVGANQKKESIWEGVFRKDPIAKEEIVVAGFTGNDHGGFPYNDIVQSVAMHDPDVLFFSGDQIYESHGGYGVQRSPLDKATLDYLRKWYMFGWAYRDLMKDRPTICITDDHDVYHGNIWGEGGKAIPAELGQGAKAQDAGGYKMPAQWVNMVQRTQTSHFPTPYDKSPVSQGITTYYTDMVYGGISFAIIEDRKFKSAPAALLPNAQITNGWPQNPLFNVKTQADISGAVLLGDRQLTFLNKWSSDWSFDTKMKVLLSQTIFVNLATLPDGSKSDNVVPKLRIFKKGEYPSNDKVVSDFDSNGWPQTGRNKAISAIRKGFAFHLAGDQHLASFIHYGVDEWEDSGFAFCVPSVTNHWPRRWFPPYQGKNAAPGAPKYTGDYEDGFGNKVSVHAVSNPMETGMKPAKIYERANGYGIVRLNKNSRELTIECWPRGSDISSDSNQYKGWPITISQERNYGRKATGYLPTFQVTNGLDPVIQIINETSNDTLYTLRISGNSYRPKVFDNNASYTVRIGRDLDGRHQIFNDITTASTEEIHKVNLPD